MPLWPIRILAGFARKERPLPVRLAITVASAYHKLVEQKELLVKSGEDYQRYRDTTPFLIPRFRRRRDSR